MSRTEGLDTPALMVRAFGYAATEFTPSNPGRLCRGREQWIPPWDAEGSEPISRLVFSGAVFSDDSAKDARRGLTCAGVDSGFLLKALFPKARLLAFKEEGEFTVVPDYAEGREAYFAPRCGGRWTDACERWWAEVEDEAELGRLVAEDLVDGFVVLPGKTKPSPGLRDALFLLTGHGDDTATPRSRFQPQAMVEILAQVPVLICVHQDKHGPALGFYSQKPIEHAKAVEAVAEQFDCLAVPFAIPPMLARWDRALYELRVEWMSRTKEEFPVPPAPHVSRWAGRAPVVKEE